MELIRKLRTKLLETWKTRPGVIWLSVIVATGTIAVFNDLARSPAQAETTDLEDKTESADTFIPEGFVLVPIEVLNYDSLDSVLGRFGVVDLFAVNSAGNAPSRLVASQIRILRAPRNPSHFAVLAPADQSSSLVRHGGGFIVVVRNPQSGGTKFETPTGFLRSGNEGGRGSDAKDSTQFAPGSRRRSRIHVEMQDD